MENFRELEKELKRKQFSKKSLQHSGKGRRGGGDGSSDDEGSGDNDSDLDDDSNGGDEESDGLDENDLIGDDFDEDDMMDSSEETKGNQIGETFLEDKPEERKKNGEYLNDAFLFMKNLVTTLEAELESIKNKKAKGATYKKYKERQVVVQTRLDQTKKLRNQFDDLRQQMDYVESMHLRALRPNLAQFMSNTEDTASINELEMELPRIVE